MPMILPPFVGAIGLRQLLSRYGSLNLALVKIGLVREDQPIDWLGGGGFWGIIVLQVFNLYPILFLNVSAAMANIDPSLREAAQNLGANGWRLFRTVTLPLILLAVPSVIIGYLTIEPMLFGECLDDALLLRGGTSVRPEPLEQVLLDAGHRTLENTLRGLR